MRVRILYEERGREKAAVGPKSRGVGQRVHHCADVVLCEVGYERRVSKASPGSQPGEQLGEDWKGYSASAWREGRSAVSRKILLSVQELLQEPILEDVRFVVVNRAVDLCRVVAGVTNFYSGVGVDLAFDAE